MILGHLSSRGIRVQRERVRRSLIRLDPDGTGQRLASFVPRRVYSVKSPRSLYHIDGNHKLRRAGFVIHGCIDGYTRMAVFLQCNTNNRAGTVLQDFLRGCQEYGLPSRVRSDYGGENIFVAAYILEQRGTRRGTFLTGASVHNQRIERLWRDVGRLVITRFRELFSSMERQSILNYDNRIHCMALHFVYRPRIQYSLDEFSRNWNFHKIDTEHNRSPRQLFIDAAFSSNGIAGNDPETVETGYGAEDVDDLETRQQEYDSVELDDVLGDRPDILHQLSQEVDPMSENGADGVHCYIHIVTVLETMYDEQPWF